MTRALPTTGQASRQRTRPAQRGVALVTAIFLIVALAALGGVMVSLSGVQQTTSGVAVASAQTLLAARGGLEWGIHRAVNNDTTMCGTSPTITTTGFSLLAANVSVTCTVKTNTSGATFVRTYFLTSTATYGAAGIPGYTQRAIEAAVCRSDAPATSTTEC